MKIRHKSDCALNNAPAYEPKPCDCGGEETLLASLAELLRRGDELLKAIYSERKLNITLKTTDFKVGMVMVRNQLIEGKDNDS